MVALFHRDVPVISSHIKNAVHEGEINEKSKLQKMQIARSMTRESLMQTPCFQNVRADIYLTKKIMFFRFTVAPKC
jgi:hypothetical protein